jgi:nitroimidazol reductase NimA-like FMN-containing flavoprotein (pyridoxamine 5'-phosphate oxidase superfamily)
VALCGARNYRSRRRHRLTPIWFLFEDDTFHFASSLRSRKVKNIERNPSRQSSSIRESLDGAMDFQRQARSRS